MPRSGSSCSVDRPSFRFSPQADIPSSRRAFGVHENRNQQYHGCEEQEREISVHCPQDISIEELFARKVAVEGGKFDEFFKDDVTPMKGELEGIALKGIPDEEMNPIPTFAEMNVPDQITRNISRCCYEKPTLIQQYISAAVLHEKKKTPKNIVACAQTGCGKTAAYLIPIVARLAHHKPDHNSDFYCKPRCLILVPTRELAWQIYNDTRVIAHGTIVTSVWAFGGTDMEYQESLLKGRTNAVVLVATPGRSNHLIEKQLISLEKLRYLVIDEADRMLEMENTVDGFIADVENIIDQIPQAKKIQVLIFSATFPMRMQSVINRRWKNNFTMLPIDKAGVNRCIEQHFIYIEQKSDKREKLMELLGIDHRNYEQINIFQEKTIIFVNKRSFADTLGSILSQAGVPAITVHADRHQEQRMEAIDAFREGSKYVLVATGVAERGLDIAGLDHVINYDLPTDIDQYVHRIGRTGRVGNNGRATSFFYPAEDREMAPALVRCLERADKEVPEWLRREASRDDDESQAGGIQL